MGITCCPTSLRRGDPSQSWGFLMTYPGSMLLSFGATTRRLTLSQVKVILSHQYAISVANSLSHQYAISVMNTLSHQYAISVMNTLSHQYAISVMNTLSHQYSRSVMNTFYWSWLLLYIKYEVLFRFKLEYFILHSPRMYRKMDVTKSMEINNNHIHVIYHIWLEYL